MTLPAATGFPCTRSGNGDVVVLAIAHLAEAAIMVQVAWCRIAVEEDPVGFEPFWKVVALIPDREEELPPLQFQALVLPAAIILEVRAVPGATLVVVGTVAVRPHVDDGMLRVFDELEASSGSGVGAAVLMEPNPFHAVAPDIHAHRLPVALVRAVLFIMDRAQVDLETGRLMAVPDVVMDGDGGVCTFFVLVEHGHLTLLQLGDVRLADDVRVVLLPLPVNRLRMSRQASRLRDGGFVQSQNRRELRGHVQLAGGVRATDGAGSSNPEGGKQWQKPRHGDSVLIP
mmetsp:Transcript_101923/g.242976  ORF Transcript_101923/g.242976 Transcript_101923/m.242976 type:complete len:286 (-) Transcript_101923:8-865(-)